MSAPPTDLERVARAAAKVDAARDELAETMRDARAAGVTLRPLARAAGLSVEWTRRIIARSS